MNYDPLEVGCLYCGVNPGQKCETSSGRLLNKPHIRRRALWTDADLDEDYDYYFVAMVLRSNFNIISEAKKEEVLKKTPGFIKHIRNPTLKMQLIAAEHGHILPEGIRHDLVDFCKS